MHRRLAAPRWRGSAAVPAKAPAVVQQRRCKSRQVMTLEISAGVGDQREAGGVRLGKSIERERSNRKNDLLLRIWRNAITIHTGAQLDLDIAHAHLAALEAEGAPQLFRFAAAEAGSNHRVV